MSINSKKRRKIVDEALSHLDRIQGDDFKCVDFVREVYAACGITIPKISPTLAPPRKFNTTIDKLKNPPIGIIVFLKDRFDLRINRTWTHLIISIGNGECVHCSKFYGGKVTISNIQEILEDRYDFVPS